MRSKQIGANTYIDQFDSIEQFYKYICDTPFNEAFRWSRHSSVENKYDFSQTNSFEEATQLLKNGWDSMAKTLTTKLEVANKSAQLIQKRRPVNGMAGYQPIVPLYLAGAPNSMVSHKMVTVKQKVVNITKLFNYSGFVNTSKIVDESVKVLQVVKKLEAQGYRTNLNIAFCSQASDRTIGATIRIKNANERLNISKLAFPLVHPSMLRRLMFRYIEVSPNTTKGYTAGYGHPATWEESKQIFTDSIVIPAIWSVDIDNVKSLEDIKGAV